MGTQIESAPSEAVTSTEGRTKHTASIIEARERTVKMKPIPKENLDELIRLTKKYYRTGDVDILPAMRYAGDQLSLCVRGDVYASSAFRDTVSAIFSGHGLKPNATYQDVYDVFALLGCEVVSDSEGDKDETA